MVILPNGCCGSIWPQHVQFDGSRFVCGDDGPFISIPRDLLSLSTILVYHSPCVEKGSFSSV